MKSKMGANLGKKLSWDEASAPTDIEWAICKGKLKLYKKEKRVYSRKIQLSDRYNNAVPLFYPWVLVWGRQYAYLNLKTGKEIPFGKCLFVSPGKVSKFTSGYPTLPPFVYRDYLYIPLPKMGKYMVLQYFRLETASETYRKFDGYILAMWDMTTYIQLRHCPVDRNDYIIEYIAPNVLNCIGFLFSIGLIWAANKRRCTYDIYSFRTESKCQIIHSDSGFWTTYIMNCLTEKKGKIRNFWKENPPAGVYLNNMYSTGLPTLLGGTLYTPTERCSRLLHKYSPLPLELAAIVARYAL